uniref:Alternative protein LIMA1 n=1 Tax=Homo sapiens TaxID=9606 RepID=L8E8R7_HUMAN|nr:alternative protein LIMA1 [Homo sapiens]
MSEDSLSNGASLGQPAGVSHQLLPLLLLQQQTQSRNICIFTWKNLL